MRGSPDDAVTPDELAYLVEHADILGDVAVISIPPSLDGHKVEIAGAIMAKRGRVKTVLNKVSMVEDDRRVPSYDILAGNDTVACYREFGFTYRFDVTKVFFNGRLGYERHRVAKKIMPGETVLIPFCGVGPFAIPAAARGGRVVAVEKNPEACRWLARNARLNGVEENIDIVNGDAFLISSMINKQFDHAIVPAPYGTDHVLGMIVPLVRKGGMLYFYTFKKKSQIEGLIGEYEGMGLTVDHYRRCGHVAPAVSRWAFGLKVRERSS